MTNNTKSLRRLPRDAFPDSPTSPMGKIPTTLDNIRFLLNECGIDLHFDVIKKVIHVRHGELELDEAELISLANLNGLGSNQFPDFIAALARRDPINPVADWILGTPWDGKDRLSALYATVTVQETEGPDT
ncbi:hypothetical protein IDJ81_13675 [Tsuneonella flava]|uniref:Uncharacterized protein n=1 Tax=Tsuneonella flava TaxID=2055955 RepID=A0ABX7K7X2_9SPHN|nr:hypothetical protein [Tsuneonella flava]QSB44346.1 hypothetical protein IDJ81_13675 [Tsuneonella flava]